jgi:hypothetical protein
MDTQDTTARITAELAALTHEFLAAVSFKQGERPRYDAIRDLFVGEGLLIKNSADAPEIASVDAFIQPRQQIVDSGALTHFREVEIADITEVFGNVAHRFSTYEKRGNMHGSDFAVRGAISTQFIRTPSGWRISSMAWDDERPGLVLPDRYR